MSGGRGNRDGLGRGTGNEAATNIFRQARVGGLKFDWPGKPTSASEAEARRLAR